jgi:hypothetical protein
MKRILTIIALSVVLSDVSAQPFALSLNNVNGSPYSCTNLDDLGTYKRLRVQSTQNSSDGRWELPQTCSFPGNVWRPYIDAEATPIPFNVVIPPTGSSYGALWNANNGGVPGRLSPVTNGNYYTFNVENITCNSGICNSPHIGVLETPYLPVTFPTVTQNPLADAVGDNVHVTVTVMSSAAPIENVFLRYTINEYVNTTIVPVSFAGTTGTAVIPGFPIGTVVKYYIYSSNKSQSLIESEVLLYGEIVHDMSTLDWNVNTTGSNYPYTVINITPISIQYLKGIKQSNFNDLSWKLECSNVNAVNIYLERSNDGINYSSIFSMHTDPSRCDQPFNYKDANFKNGLNYYRLKIQNTDGEKKYSTVVALLNNSSSFEIVHSGLNPVNNDVFSVEVAATKSLKLNCRIFDMSGRTLKISTTTLSAGNNRLNSDVYGLASGMYCMSLQTNDGVLRTIKFVKR